MLFSLIVLSDSGKPSDPEISPLISARCAGYTAVRLMAHSRSSPLSRCTRHAGGATHAVASPFFQMRGLVDRDPGPIRSPSGSAEPGRRPVPAAPPAGPSSPTHRTVAGLHPAPALMPGRLRQAPTIRPHPRRQRQHVRERYLHAAALRHHPVQNRHDLGHLPARRTPRHPLCWPARPWHRLVSSQTQNRVTAASSAHAQSRAEHPLNSVTHRQIRCGTAAQNLTRRSRTARLSALIVKQRL